jgi:hypothetical protein
MCLLFALIGLAFALIASGHHGGMKFFDNLVLALPAIIAALSAMLALFIGLMSIVK